MSSRLETTSPPPDHEFDLLEFWIKHKPKIVFCAVLLVVSLVVSAGYQAVQLHQRTAAQGAYLAATKPEDFRKIAQEYPALATGGTAQLELAELLRQDGKLDDSSAALQSFIHDHPQHPLISGAYTSLAANQELQGKLPEALDNYKRVIGSYPASFSSAAAWMGQARILAQQGKTDEARHSYETVVTQFAGSLFSQEAMTQSQKLKKAEPAAPASAGGLPEALKAALPPELKAALREGKITTSSGPPAAAATPAPAAATPAAQAAPASATPAPATPAKVAPPPGALEPEK